ncbi:GvpL/GvpF family gas vesicle protein [Pseudanabaena sp. FACHB-1998]|uniref:GvpL/GvpF family gas vesicle protein n=1 Tax=Pseudanabaena sp. FACHB-1998 TaxID=2692858 RepID=UPI001680C105|nr:GvpL/GvpF family gas vesicle protein [Pseudanabaena sp. FACHB-1998]MBD2175420.1 GvpL/GvpF family gas vesicle protein [Pseudanabaena sp. FACHB-1998]
MSLYLYAILQAENLDLIQNIDLNGMNSQPIQFHAIPPFAIVYSEAQQERYLASRANLLAHETVLESLMKAIDPYQAVPLPLQFGLVVEEWEEVQRDLLIPYEDQLKGLINNLIGKREVSVKLFWNQTEELNLAVLENQDLQKRREALVGKMLSMDEAISIGQDLEAAIEQRQQVIVKTFLETLKPLSYDYAEGELLTENMIYNGSFLIDWNKEPEFAATVEALDKQFENRLRIRYNDFTAPYNFVNVDREQ